MLVLHAQRTLITAVIVANVVLALWGFLAHRRGQRTVSSGFWTLLLVMEALLVLQVATGVVLAVVGARPRSGLHFLYGVLVGALALYQFGLRPGGFVRGQHMLWGLNPRAASGIALICLTQAALVARAYTTGAFGR